MQTVTAVPMRTAHGRSEQHGGGRNPQIHRQGPSGHAAGERRDFRRIREEIADERQVAINIASAGQGRPKEAGGKRTCGCDGQDGRPAKCEDGGARCARKGRHPPSAAACEQANEGGCFGTPPATDFDAKDGEMAPQGSNKLRALFGSARAGADLVPGKAAADAGRRKRQTTYPERVAARRCRLVVLALEVGGRFGAHDGRFPLAVGGREGACSASSAPGCNDASGLPSEMSLGAPLAGS